MTLDNWKKLFRKYIKVVAGGPTDNTREVGMLAILDALAKALTELLLSKFATLAEAQNLLTTPVPALDEGGRYAITGPWDSLPESKVYVRALTTSSFEPTGILVRDGVRSVVLVDVAAGTTASTQAAVGGRNRGPWAAATLYQPFDWVTQTGLTYYANSDFTSGATFDATQWTQFGAGLTPAQVLALNPLTYPVMGLSATGLKGYDTFEAAVAAREANITLNRNVTLTKNTSFVGTLRANGAEFTYVYTQPWKRSASPGIEAADNTNLHQGAQVDFNVLTSTCTITQVGFYDLRADQDVSIYCQSAFNGEVAATVQLWVNGALVNEDAVRGKGRIDASLTALAERQFLHVGDTVQARYKFDGFKTGILSGSGPFGAEWELKPSGRLTVQLLSDFPPGGRVHLADWLPAMSCKDYVKGIIQAYGLTQTTDPYTAAVTFRRTAQVVDDPRTSGLDWSERRDGTQPARRSWKLGDLAQRNWFRWKDDESNTGYAQAVFEASHAGQPWDADAAKLVAQAYGAGYLDNGAGDTSLAATKDVLTLPFAASPMGAAGLLLIPYWKPKPGTDYQDDLAVIQAALDDGTYSPEEAKSARAKALGDDFETQTPQPRLVYQSLATRQVLLEDDEGHRQEVSMRLSYFVDRAQREDLDFSRCLLPLYYPHLAAALARPLVLRPWVRLSAAEVVDFDPLQAVWLEDEQAWFYVNKVDGWEDGQPSVPVELVRVS